MMGKWSYTLTGKKGVLTGEFTVTTDDDYEIEAARVVSLLPRDEVLCVAFKPESPPRDEELTPSGAVRIAQEIGFKRVIIDVDEGGPAAYAWER